MNLLKKIIYMLLISITFSCSEKELNNRINDSNVQNKNNELTKDSSFFAIIEYDSLNPIFSNFEINNAYPSKFNFTEIIKVDSILKGSITDYNNTKAIERFNIYKNKSSLNGATIDNFKIDLKNFKVQYVPLNHYKSDKIVFVNCFCKDFDTQNKSNWKKEIVHVLDGGNCFFNVKINLTKRTYFQFSVNSNG